MFYYVLENGVVNVYTAKGLGLVLKTYNFDEVTGDELHRLARGRIKKWFQTSSQDTASIRC